MYDNNHIIWFAIALINLRACEAELLMQRFKRIKYGFLFAEIFNFVFNNHLCRAIVVSDYNADKALLIYGSKIGQS